MIHTVNGLVPTTLLGYLSTLGLVRAVSTADPEARFWWEGNVPHIDTHIDDLAAFLVDDFVPLPAISPWNGGSGFGDKDKNQREALMRLVDSTDPRLTGFADAFTAAKPIKERSDAQGWDKTRLIRELRNELPDDTIEWLDAAVIVASDANASAALRFPPITGTGGNDGRLEFSARYHKALADVLEPLDAKRTKTLGWASDLITGNTTTPLLPYAVGQFEPMAGMKPSLMNPWTQVLLINGLPLFAASAVKRLSGTASRASIPFTVYYSPEGPTPGADEESRGEVWAPIWSKPLQAQGITQLFHEARMSWNGSPATQAADAYAAIRSLGVNREIARFIRFGVLQRNGLAFTADVLDDVDVAHRTGIELITAVERRVRRLATVDVAGLGGHQKRWNTTHMAFVRDPSPDTLISALSAAGQLEIAANRSSKAKDAVAVMAGKPSAQTYVEYLNGLLQTSPDLRLGASLASATYRNADGRNATLSELIGGSGPSRGSGWVTPRVDGLGRRPFTQVLADAIIQRSHHVKAVTAQEDNGRVRGFVPFTHRFRPHWRDAHLWVHTPEMDGAVFDAFVAFSVFDWADQTGPSGTGIAPSVLPDTALALLQTFAAGHVAPAANQEHRVGLQHNWPTLLASRSVAHTRRVLGEACSRLRQGTIHPPGKKPFSVLDVTVPSEVADPNRGHRLLAALATAPHSYGLTHVVPTEIGPETLLDPPTSAPLTTH